MFGVWRLACGALRFIFFARCLVLQLSPPARRRDGGGAAAAAAGGGWPAPGAKMSGISPGVVRMSGISPEVLRKFSGYVQTGTYAPNA